MIMNDLKKLIDFNSWANEKWIQFIANELPDEKYLLSQMSHILLGEQAWLQRINGIPPDKEIWISLPIPRLWEFHNRHKKEFSAILNSDIQKIINYQRFSGEKHSSSICDILYHLVLHAVHHRGQMAAKVSETNSKVINTDYIEYCRIHNST
jgi:uncharacterized damage-inducible protein DinB